MNTDVLNRALKWIDHNRYLVISLVMFTILAGTIIGAIGCKSTTTGLIADPATGTAAAVDRREFVSQTATLEKDFTLQRVQLEAQLAAYNEEVNAFNERVEAGHADLDRQDEFRREVVNTIGVVATSAAEGTLNPVSLIPLGIGLLGGALGLGAAADNRRKDKVISTLKKT